MAIVLTKKKVAAPPISDELVSDFAELIDRVGTLAVEAEKIQARIKEEQERLKPYNAAVAELAEKIAELEIDDDATGMELGAAYKAEYGKRGTSREITDMEKVRQLMGDELFNQVATVTLKNIDDYLTAPQRKQVIKENRTKRTVKVIKRVA